MNECYIIYDTEQHRFYSESEYMWSLCIGTFYPTQEAAVRLWRVTVSTRQRCARYDCSTVKTNDEDNEDTPEKDVQRVCLW